MNGPIQNQVLVKQLYRNILKEHRRLPLIHRELGNKYVMSEFRLHKKCNDMQRQQFLNEWSRYLSQLKRQRQSFGIKMSEAQLSSLSKDQIEKLKETII